MLRNTTNGANWRYAVSGAGAGPVAGQDKQWFSRLNTPGMIDRNDMPELRSKMCELAEQVAGSFGVTLDYSERSVHDVERILGEVHEEYRRTKSEEGLQGLALEFGAYLVSVLEKHRGPVVWKRDHPEFGEDAFPLEWRGTTLFPVGWCLKRIVDGPGDSISFKWKALILNRDGEPAENERRDNEPLQRTGAAKWFSWIRKLFGRGLGR